MTIKTVVIPSVEVMRKGTWTASTGSIEITDALMESVRDAAHDPNVDQIPLKLGHVDPRFDGQPAFGWLKNHRIVGDRMLADIVDVPEKLADVARVAFKRRSPELRRNITTAGGKTYDYTMSALSLLGVTPPAMKGMGDLLGLFADGDKAQDGGFYVHMASEHDDVIAFELATTLADGDIDTGDVITDKETKTVDEAKIRELFKLAPEADIEAELAKIAANPPKAAELAEDDGTVKISKAVYEDLRSKAEEGAGAAAMLKANRAQDVVQLALNEGRIAPIDAEKWTARLTADYDGEVVRLGELVPGVRMNTKLSSDGRTSIDLADGSKGMPSDQEIADFLGANAYIVDPKGN